jgi:hypothetical protein
MVKREVEMQSRRTFCLNAFHLSAGVGFSSSLELLAQTVPLVAEPSLASAGPVEVPANFTGLGYEMSSVAAAGLLRTSNRRYVELIRGLGPEGVLRVGGIVANYTSYLPDGTSKSDRLATIITRKDMEGFAEFLDGTGWTAIWSVNFAQGSIAQAIEEARAVKEILGRRLLALEIGNEVDTYGRGQPFRTAPYNYETYRREFAEWHAAIVEAVPGIPFAAPDTAGAADWAEKMAADAKGDVQLLTTHYYRNGQKRGSAEQLLSPDPRLDEIAVRLRVASAQSGTPWRMCEMNSFSGGGLPGVSDTFIGALWTLDVMLRLAESGCAGVNIETGVNQLGFVSSYSAIQDDGKGANSAGVPYYGMLAFATAFAGCHQMFPVENRPTSDAVSMYALGSQGKVRRLVVINRNRKDNVRVSLAQFGLEHILEHADVMRLEAPAAESTAGVTLGRAAVDEAGRWQAKSHEWVRSRSVDVPRMSAIVLRSAT